MSRVIVRCSVCGNEYQEMLWVIRRAESAKRNLRCFECRRDRCDELSHFRRFISVARRRATQKGLEFNITPEYLKHIWESHSGICPYTGWGMGLPRSANYRQQHTPYKTSLDRIDSSKGYISGNVQLVTYMAQMAKNNFTGDELVQFCEAVVKYQTQLKSSQADKPG